MKIFTDEPLAQSTVEYMCPVPEPKDEREPAIFLPVVGRFTALGHTRDIIDDAVLLDGHVEIAIKRVQRNTRAK